MEMHQIRYFLAVAVLALMIAPGWAVGRGDQHADFAFAYGAPAGPVALVSTIKLRKAGFNAAIDTRNAICGALQSFIDRSVLPPARY